MFIYDKGAGAQGTQNGSVSCVVFQHVPSGIREILGET